MTLVTQEKAFNDHSLAKSDVSIACEHSRCIYGGLALTMIGSVAAGIAILGLGFGFASAYFWWKSSRLSFEIGMVHMVTPTGVGIAVGPLERYLKRVGNLNAKAAICGAVGVLFSTFAGIIGLFSNP